MTVMLTNGLWLMLGIALGAAHAWATWRSAQRAGSLTALVGAGRIFVVAAVLAVSAFAGGVLAAAAGWFIAFSIAVTATWWRTRP